MKLINDLKYQFKTGDIPQKLIFINILVFILSTFFFDFHTNQYQYPNWLALSSNYKDLLYFPYTLLSFCFLHSNLMHLIFNLIFLYYIGVLFYSFFNSRQFLTVYFFGSFFSGITFVLYGYFFNHDNLIIGASASIMAVFVAVATYSPNYPIKLPLIGFVKLWHLAFLYLLIDIIQLLTENTGGHLVHLSGSIIGFVYAMLIKKGIDISEIFLLKKKKNITFKKVYINTTEKRYQSARIDSVNFKQRQIDEILEKISKSGYDSLTKKEKEFLFKENK